VLYTTLQSFCSSTFYDVYPVFLLSLFFVLCFRQLTNFVVRYCLELHYNTYAVCRKCNYRILRENENWSLPELIKLTIKS